MTAVPFSWRLKKLRRSASHLLPDFVSPQSSYSGTAVEVTGLPMTVGCVFIPGCCAVACSHNEHDVDRQAKAFAKSSLLALHIRIIRQRSWVS